MKQEDLDPRTGITVALVSIVLFFGFMFTVSGLRGEMLGNVPLFALGLAICLPGLGVIAAARITRGWRHFPRIPFLRRSQRDPAGAERHVARNAKDIERGLKGIAGRSTVLKRGSRDSVVGLKIQQGGRRGTAGAKGDPKWSHKDNALGADVLKRSRADLKRGFGDSVTGLKVQPGYKQDQEVGPINMSFGPVHIKRGKGDLKGDRKDTVGALIIHQEDEEDPEGVLKDATDDPKNLQGGERDITVYLKVLEIGQRNLQCDSELSQGGTGVLIENSESGERGPVQDPRRLSLVEWKEKGVSGVRSGPLRIPETGGRSSSRDEEVKSDVHVEATAPPTFPGFTARTRLGSLVCWGNGDADATHGVHTQDEPASACLISTSSSPAHVGPGCLGWDPLGSTPYLHLHTPPTQPPPPLLRGHCACVDQRLSTLSTGSLGMGGPCPRTSTYAGLGCLVLNPTEEKARLSTCSTLPLLGGPRFGGSHQKSTWGTSTVGVGDDVVFERCFPLRGPPTRLSAAGSPPHPWTSPVSQSSALLRSLAEQPTQLPTATHPPPTQSYTSTLPQSLHTSPPLALPSSLALYPTPSKSPLPRSSTFPHPQLSTSTPPQSSSPPPAQASSPPSSPCFPTPTCLLLEGQPFRRCREGGSAGRVPPPGVTLCWKLKPSGPHTAHVSPCLLVEPVPKRADSIGLLLHHSPQATQQCPLHGEAGASEGEGAGRKEVGDRRAEIKWIGLEGITVRVGTIEGPSWVFDGETVV